MQTDQSTAGAFRFGLERFLQERFVEFCHTIERPGVPFRINPPLGPEEITYFCAGLEQQLFSIDPSGSIRSELFRSGQGEETGRLFGQDPPRLYRETVCQLATASLLVFKRGWLRSQISMEPYHEDQGRTRGAALLVKSLGGQLVAGVEIKRNSAELQKLMRDFRQCCRRGPHPEAECGFPQNHSKYEFCAAFRPMYFWAVAPYEDICFWMNYRDALIEPEEMQTLPPRSLLE